MAHVSSDSSAVPLDNSSAAEGWCKKRFKVVTYSHIWKIDNYYSSHHMMEMGESLETTFSTNPKDEQQPKWQLKLFPRGCEEKSNDHLSLFLHLAQDNKAAVVDVKAKFEIMDEKCDKTNTMWGSETFVQGERGWACAKFLLRAYLYIDEKKLLPNDQLTINCEISMVIDTIKGTGPNKFTTLGPIPKSSLVEDFGALLEKGLFTDCVLCADDKEFKVHKAVLACRAPLFAAFTNETEEKQTGQVNIPDISAPILGQLLHFVYTGQEPPLLAEQDMAEGLLAAANKYQLDRLKAICEHELCLGLNSENVCKVLVLAGLHSAERLKAHAIEYISWYADEVMGTDGWRTLSSPELVKQVFKAALSIRQTIQEAS